MEKGEDRLAPLIDAALVERLVVAQMPQWAGLPIRAADPQGWDNRTFRLGSQLGVRLPSAPGYVAQVYKEHRVLPLLAAQLPLPIPAPMARGEPGEGYPFAWSVYRWLDGTPAAAPLAEPVAVARALAGFLTALQRTDPAGGPPPGGHSAWRGGPLQTYDAETRSCIMALDGLVDARAATSVWDAALAASWDSGPVWFHGDVAADNLVLRDAQLAAVIDFGCCGVGDPACDLTVAWTLLNGPAREVLRSGLDADPGTWARARGWALWKALITVAERDGDPRRAAASLRVIYDVLAEHGRHENPAFGQARSKAVPQRVAWVLAVIATPAEMEGC